MDGIDCVETYDEAAPAPGTMTGMQGGIVEVAAGAVLGQDQSRRVGWGQARSRARPGTPFRTEVVMGGSDGPCQSGDARKGVNLISGLSPVVAAGEARARTPPPLRARHV